MKEDFGWDTVTSGIVSHYHTVVAGRHAVRDPTNQRKSVPLSASTLSTPGKPRDPSHRGGRQDDAAEQALRRMQRGAAVRAVSRGASELPRCTGWRLPGMGLRGVR